MIFTRTKLDGARLIEMEKREDARGFFARAMCRAEFEAEGLVSDFVQQNHSCSRRRGTLRGVHFQRAPHAEDKLIRCVRGAMYDVILDLRPASPTYMRWQAFELTDSNGLSIYVPKGFAHGFQTLTDDVELIYHVSHPYSPQAEWGIRYDDPAFGIVWPERVTTISDRDVAWPDFTPAAALPL